MLSKGKLGDLHTELFLSSIHDSLTMDILDLWVRDLGSQDEQPESWFSGSCLKWYRHVTNRQAKTAAFTCNESRQEESVHVPQRMLRFCFYCRSRLLLLAPAKQLGRDNNGIYLLALCWQRVVSSPDHQWLLPEWLFQDPSKQAEMILEIKHMAECEVSPAPGSHTRTVVSWSVSIGLIMGNESKFSLWKLKLLMIVLSQILWSFEMPARNFETGDLLQLHTILVFKC